MARLALFVWLVVDAVLLCSSFTLRHKTRVILANPSIITELSSKNADPNSVNTDADVEYLNFRFEQTKDALKNAATAFTGEVEKNFKSGLSDIASKGNSDIEEVKTSVESAAKYASTGFYNVAKRGGEDVLEFANKVSAFGGEGLKETSTFAADFATRGTGDLLRMTERGISSLQSLSINGTEKVGDVAKWIDEQSKNGSALVSSKAKSIVLSFTRKDEYEFGDVTNELIRRIASKEIAVQDTILVIKLLVALGASIGPLAKVLPLTVLLEALNISLEQKIGGKVLEALALSIDNRIVAAFSSDDKVQLGDAVKRTVLSGVLAFTNKSTYESGDIKRVIENSEDDVNDELGQLDLQLNAQLLEWDRLFVQRCIESAQDANNPDAKTLDMKICIALEECSKIEEESRKNKKSSIGATDNYFNQLDQ